MIRQLRKTSSLAWLLLFGSGALFAADPETTTYWVQPCADRTSGLHVA